MANRFNDLRFLFDLIQTSITNTPSEENAHNMLAALLECIEGLEDPALASNFQTYWFEISDKIKNISDENHFIIQERLIKLNIERVMFPELSELAVSR